MRNPIFLLVCLVVLAGQPATGLAQDDSTYLVAGWMIDTLRGERIADPVVEINAGRIVAVSTGAAPVDATRVIDLGDPTLHARKCRLDEYSSRIT